MPLLSLATPQIISGLDSSRELRDGMRQPITPSQNAIEMYLLERGWGRYFIGGDIIVFRPRRMIVFWGIWPHQLIQCGRYTVINRLTIPLPVFRQWRLPESIFDLFKTDKAIVEPQNSCYEFDRLFFATWHRDLRSQDNLRLSAAMLEIKARLCRLALHVEGRQVSGVGRNVGPLLPKHIYLKKISVIADYVSTHFAEPLTIPKIAAAISMRPTSATKIFKKICGMNLIHYLTQHRVVHAQRLLATSKMKIKDIALASGFRSLSRFYASFQAYHGVSPLDFRVSCESGDFGQNWPRLPKDRNWGRKRDVL